MIRKGYHHQYQNVMILGHGQSQKTRHLSNFSLRSVEMGLDMDIKCVADNLRNKWGQTINIYCL